MNGGRVDEKKTNKNKSKKMFERIPMLTTTKKEQNNFFFVQIN